MGIMIIPFVSSLSDDVINAVPQELRDGSFALGATHSETIRQVVLPAALPGIVGGVLLAASRAIGVDHESCHGGRSRRKSHGEPAGSGNHGNRADCYPACRRPGVRQRQDTWRHSLLGLLLFATTLILNIIALRVVRRYREQYE